jgi:hypothetical protein
MTSPLDPRIGDAGVKLEMGICKVKKTYRLIKLTSASVLMWARKGIASSLVIDWNRGWPLVVGVGTSWLVSTTTGGAARSSCAGGGLDPT